MTTTIIGLFDEYSAAEGALLGLLSAGFSERNIGIVAAARTLTQLDPEHLEGGPTLVKDLSALALPDLDTVVAAGPLLPMLRDNPAGGLAGALRGMGIPADEAGYYAEGVRRGGILLAVLSDAGHAPQAAELLGRHHPVDLASRSAEWRHAGYTPSLVERRLHHPHHPGEQPFTQRKGEADHGPQRGVRVYASGQARGE